MTALPTESIFVVTGANGYIGAHIVDQLLKRGYHVRALVRSLKRASWLEATFTARHPEAANLLTVHEIEDVNVPGALDDVLNGAIGLVMVGSDTSFGPNPHEVVTPVVNNTRSLLESAGRSPSLKTVVVTSSVVTLAPPRERDGKLVFDTEFWNEAATKAAWAPPPYTPERSHAVYAASKIEGEQAAWEWVRQNKPHFTFNAVLPALNLGSYLDLAHQKDMSTAGWVRDFFRGDTAAAKRSGPTIYVNVVDVALIHVAALIYPDIKNERILAGVAPFRWNEALALWRKAWPQVSDKLIDDIEWPAPAPKLSYAIDNKRGEELLQRVNGTTWVGLDQSLLDTVADLV